MTDKQLHHAIHDLGAGLLNGQGPILQESFVRYGSPTAMSDPRFPHAMPVTVRGHVLTMVTEANDAFGLSLLGLQKHASAAALGAIRLIAETLAWATWLLESPDDETRQARAYRLTLNAIEGYGKAGKTLTRVAGQSPQTAKIAPRLAAAEKRMKRNLTALADQNAVNIPTNPGSMSMLAERYLAEHGGYLFYALLNSAGAHPGAARSFQFYGIPGTGVADYDFKGKYNHRAYWITRSIRLDMCHLAAPVLGWGQDWEILAAQTQSRLGPLAEEAERRYLKPLQQAMANAPDNIRQVAP